MTRRRRRRQRAARQQRHAPLRRQASRRTPDRTRTRSARPARCTACSRAPHRHGAHESTGRQQRPRPVNCLVTNALYSHSGQHVLIPAGARVLGETQARAGARRDAPGRGLPSAADAGRQHVPPRPVPGPEPDWRRRPARPRQSPLPVDVRRGGGRRPDQRPRRSTSAAPASAAATGDRTIVIAGGAAMRPRRPALQVMNRFLNRLPTITIREGHRVKVYLTSDLELPAYPPASHGRVLKQEDVMFRRIVARPSSLVHARRAPRPRAVRRHRSRQPRRRPC